MTSNGRVARLTALALATGTLVAAGAGAASAATTSTSKGAPLQYGQAVGSVLRIEINLPAGLPGNLLPQHIIQDISLTDGTVNTLTSAVSGDALAALGSKESNIPVVSDLLASFASHATLANPSPKSSALVNIDQGGLKLQVLPAVSNVLNPTKTLNGIVSESHSAVANVDLSVAGLSGALKPVIDQLTTTLGTVVGTVGNTSAPVVTTVTSTLNTLAGTLKSTTPVDVTTAVNTVSATLTNTLTTLQSLPTALAGTDTLVHIAKLNSDRVISRNGDSLTATSSNALSNVEILGGLVTVDALKSSATATATGVQGGASAAKPDSQVVRVHIKGVADLFLDKTGIHLQDTLGTLVPSTVTDTVNTALTQLQGAISLLGISVQDGVGTSKVAADGRSAESHASGAAIEINPLKLIDPKAAPLVRLSMVNSNALVAATPVTLVKTSTPPVTVSSLPRTGANLPMTGAIATGLVGLAFVARRRRMAHLAD